MSTTRKEPRVKDYSVPSLERGMAILELLSRCPAGLGLVEIAAALELPHNAVFRIGNALVQGGYLARDQQSKKFVLSRKLLTVGLGAVHERNVVECAFDLLRAMRNELKETVALAALLPDEAHGVVLLSLDHLYDYGLRIRVGYHFDLHCSGPGKALLAFLPEDEQAQVIQRINFVQYTPHTILSADGLRRDLAVVRQTGYALDREEYAIDGYCVGAPVLDAFGYPVAAIWIAGQLHRIAPHSYETLGSRVMHYAAAISQRLIQPAT
jgi:DNA-binding IclR family transcriptional regulator